MSLLLPTSIGEALDKLNILDLKLKKIKDEKRLKYVKSEFDELNDILKIYLTKNKFYYNILFKVNEKIWDIQDDLRLNEIPSSNDIYKIILDENDRRCRIKNKINSKIRSSLREQKGYPLKKAFVCTHLGLGDMICMIGIVRYLSTIYDEVYVLCKERYFKNAELFYKDDDTIKLVACNDHYLPVYKQGEILDDKVIYCCGYHSKDYLNCSYIDNIPEIFYQQIDLSYEIAQEYFYIDSEDYEKDPIIQEILKYKYYFVHDSASNLKLNLNQDLIKDDILIINPNKNPYPIDHPFYKFNQYLSDKPLVYFIPIIQNAFKIYCIDSSFFNLINFLDTSKVQELYVYSRDNRQYKLFTKFKYLN